MKKLLSIMLAIVIISSICAVSVTGAGAQSVDTSYISSAVDGVAPVGVRTFCVSEEAMIPYSDVDGYPYGYVGDVDFDDDVSVLDATAIQMHIAQLSNLMLTTQKLADVDFDNEISILDATEIQLYVAKMSQSQTIFHVLYSPYDNFDPMLDTFDDIVNYLQTDGEYDNNEECYYLDILQDEDGGQVYAAVEYSELFGDITLNTTAYNAEVDATMIVNMYIDKGSKKFRFDTYLYTSDFVLYEATGNSELINITEDLDFVFDTKFSSVNSEFGYTSADIVEGLDLMFMYNLYFGEELLIDGITGSVYDLVYDMTTLL